MKFRLIPTAFAAAAALMASQAQALDIATVNSAATIKVYASGASAIRNIVGQVFQQNCASSLDIYYSSANVAGLPAGTTANFSDADGNAHRVYSCTLKAEAQLDTDLKGKGLGGKNIAFFKRDAGGSGIGVFPVGIPSNSANLLISAASCASTGNTAGFNPATGSTTASFRCVKDENVRAPELGFSDVEPQLFKGINTPSGFPTAGLSTVQLAGLTVVPTFQTVMAVAVSDTLYQALQVAQSTSGRPSISRTTAGSLFRGELAAPADGLGWQALGVANPDKQVNVCRRVNGSGTQAAANLTFSQLPCSLNANTPPATAGFSDPAQPNAINASTTFNGGNAFFFEGSGAGNVISCLEAASTAGAYAVGHVSRENGETANFKFVSLDGVEPNRDNLKAGLYDYAVESTAQYRKALITALKAGTADDKAKAGFIEGFAKAVGRPVNMDKLATATKLGLAALPTAGIYNDPSDPIAAAFVSRVGRTNGANCTPFSVQQ